jgi:hypothetical protein
VVDEVALGDVEPVTQRRVQRGQPDAVPLLLGRHGFTVPLAPGSGNRAATIGGAATSSWLSIRGPGSVSTLSYVPERSADLIIPEPPPKPQIS